MKFIVALFILTTGSLYSFAQDSKKEIKQQQQAEEYILVKELVESGKFEFVGIRAIPLKGGQIDLTSRANFMRVIDGNVSASMPYIGVAHDPTMAGKGGGVVFDGTPENYQVNENDKKQKVVVKFRIKENGEIYDCILTVSNLDYAKISITSTFRSSISYIGQLGPLTKPESK